ncbi:MAG: 23S rRNA (uracil(1939)-C(5))-methyltransferase RlmD, partial [Clostridia bacterium]|nr:23S rRNA (uracil(1939)-C(5))-methyltransferase RlmD [Clostridia bacterium]
MEILKNNEYIVDIRDMGINAEGVAKIEGFPIFIKDGIIDEKVKIKIIKVSKDYAIGKIIEIIEKSKYREEPFCSQYVRCGGCNMQHIEYKKQLDIKMNQVKNSFKKFGLDENKIIDIIGMDNPYEYRNKVQYPVGLDNNGEPVIGFYAPRSHDIVSNDICKIEYAESAKIIRYIKQYIKDNNISIYDEIAGKGYLKHIVIKIGFNTKQIMVIFVTNNFSNGLKDLEKELVKNFEQVKTVVQNINMRNSNVIMGDENKVLYGNGYIQDKLGEYVFNISPNSFYQVNPVQAKVLYDIAKQYVESANILFDLYCGIGTIGIYCSDISKEVYAIEIVEQAIEDAEVNAKNNNINNIEFLVGAVEDKINDLY